MLADLAQIAAAIDAGIHEPLYAVGSHDRRPTLTEPAFVGRRRELQQLDEWIRQAQAGGGSLVFVESASGGGKTRLLAELALRGAQQGMSVFRGQGCEQIGQRPFQVLEGVVGQLIEATRSDAEIADAVRGRLGDHCDAAAAAVPELATALGWQSSERLGPEAFGEAQHSGFGHVDGRAGIEGASRDDRAGRLPVGGRIDDQAHRTMVREPAAFAP